MAKSNPTRGPLVVPIDLPGSQLQLLRKRFGDWLVGLREDLEDPEPLKDPAQARREVVICERMLVCLGTRQLALPDREALEFLVKAAKSEEEQSHYEEVTSTHEALEGFLELLRRGEEGR